MKTDWRNYLIFTLVLIIIALGFLYLLELRLDKTEDSIRANEKRSVNNAQILQQLIQAIQKPRVKADKPTQKSTK